jgi:hypothetical protein
MVFFFCVDEDLVVGNFEVSIGGFVEEGEVETESVAEMVLVEESITRVVGEVVEEWVVG